MDLGPFLTPLSSARHRTQGCAILLTFVCTNTHATVDANDESYIQYLSVPSLRYVAFVRISIYSQQQACTCLASGDEGCVTKRKPHAFKAACSNDDLACRSLLRPFLLRKRQYIPHREERTAKLEVSRENYTPNCRRVAKQRRRLSSVARSCPALSTVLILLPWVHVRIEIQGNPDRAFLNGSYLSTEGRQLILVEISVLYLRPLNCFLVFYPPLYQS